MIEDGTRIGIMSMEVVGHVESVTVLTSLTLYERRDCGRA